MSHRLERIVVAILVVARLALALGFSAGPVFEAADEGHHYRYVRYVDSTHALPGPDTLFVGKEAFQPPLYYWLSALLTTGFDHTAVSDAVRQHTNPFFAYEARAPGGDNKNAHLHALSEAFPYLADSTVLAIHVIRLFGVLAAGLTAFLSYLIFQIIWPDRSDLRVIALSVVAFWPQALFIAGVVSNDNLMALTATLSLWLLLRQHRLQPTWGSAALLGVALGAALLSKGTAVFLAVPVGALVLLDRRSWRYAALTLAITLALAGWWFARNMALYGEPSGIGLHFLLEPRARILPGSQSLSDWVWRMTVYLYPSLWGIFGTDDIVLADWLYRFYDIVALLAAAGMVIRLIRTVRASRESRPSPDALRMGLVMASFALIWLVALGLHTTASNNGPYGRHLLAGIAGWGALAAWGLDAWMPHRLRTRLALTLAALTGAGAIASFSTYWLAYQVPPVPAAIAAPLDYRYEGLAELIGTDASTVHVRPGDRLHISLYWRADRPSDTGLIAYLHTVDSNVVRRDSYPATGNLLSTDWLPGQTWADNYLVVIPADAPVQRVYPLIAGLLDPQSDRTLTAVDASGKQTLPVVGRIAVHGPAAPFEPDYRFGGVIGMAQPEISRGGSGIQVCLRWVSLAAAPADYQVFVHALAGDGPPLAQSDFQAGSGLYPTGVWWVGESIRDCATLAASSLPPAGWRISVGLYDLATGQRLPVKDRAGNELDNNAVEIQP